MLSPCYPRTFHAATEGLSRLFPFSDNSTRLTIFTFLPRIFPGKYTFIRGRKKAEKDLLVVLAARSCVTKTAADAGGGEVGKHLSPWPDVAYVALQPYSAGLPLDPVWDFSVTRINQER